MSELVRDKRVPTLITKGSFTLSGPRQDYLFEKQRKLGQKDCEYARKLHKENFTYGTRLYTHGKGEHTTATRDVTKKKMKSKARNL